MYYEEMRTRERVEQEDAYEYAKENLDKLSQQDRADFIEWFFSDNWIEKNDSEIGDWE